MIRGIGVDTVRIQELARLIAASRSGSFLRRTFSERELAASQKTACQAEYLATRFAAKEAVFKALAHLTQKQWFDLRIVETLNNPDGSPYVNVSQTLQAVLAEAKADTLHISITTEGDYATAFVIAEQI